MNVEQKEALLESELQAVFKDAPVALDWLRLVTTYFGKVDDIVDGDIPPREILNVTFMSAEVFNHPFWLENRKELFPILVTVSITYADTVAWEKETGWKKAYAKALRHVGQDFFRYIIYRLAGYAKLQQLSNLMREVAYEHHSSDKEFLDS